MGSFVLLRQGGLGMGWKSVFLGNESPSRARLIAMSFTYAVLGLLGHGLITDFIPTADWLSDGVIPSVLVAGILSLAFYWTLLTDRGHFALETPQLVRWLAVVLAPVLLFMCCLIVLVYAGGDLQARFWGRPQSVTVTLEKQHTNSRRTCHYRLVGEDLKRSLFKHACVQQERYGTLPARAAYVLVGRSSSLGLHIDEIMTSSGERILSPLEALLR